MPMNNLCENPTLKDINAYKKKICWGDLPTIFHMAINSISDVDGILSHGFDSAYKRLFNQNTWNLDLLGSYTDDIGNVIVKSKPKIALHHVFDEQNYELHCYPIIDDEKINVLLLKHPQCPFINWMPETMQMLFRMSSFVSFMTYHAQGGDEADLALIKFAYYKVEELIDVLKDSFEVTEVLGHTIAEFYQEIQHKKKHLS
jgi:hypothetical protein